MYGSRYFDMDLHHYCKVTHYHVLQIKNCINHACFLQLPNRPPWSVNFWAILLLHSSQQVFSKCVYYRRGAVTGNVDTGMTYKKTDVPFISGFLPTCPKVRQANGPTQWSVTSSGTSSTARASTAGLPPVSCPPSQMVSSPDLTLNILFPFSEKETFLLALGLTNPVGLNLLPLGSPWIWCYSPFFIFSVSIFITSL